MQNPGWSSCPWAAFSQKTPEGSGWSHLAALKLTNLPHSCLRIGFSRAIPRQLFGKPWCGPKVFFPSLAASLRSRKPLGCWGWPWMGGRTAWAHFGAFKVCRQQTLSVRSAFGRIALTYGLQGSKPRRSSSRAAFETLDPADIMRSFYLTCEHLWQGIRSLVLCLLL